MRNLFNMYHKIVTNFIWHKYMDITTILQQFDITISLHTF